MTENRVNPSAPQQRQFSGVVIFDWNIVQYWISKKMRPAILPVLHDIDGANFQFSMSEISLYEAQCLLPKGKHEESIQFMNGIPRYSVDTNTHLVAGILRSCYTNHKDIKGHGDDISLQDIFNASCAILNGGFILTADPHDYPIPFFDPVYYWTIQDPTGKRQKIYLIKPDVLTIDEYAVQWVKSTEANKANKIKQQKGKAL